MTTTFLEPGGSATYDKTLWSATGANITIVSDFVHGQPRSIRATNTGANHARKSGICADAGTRVSFWFYVVALPGAGGSASIFRVADSSTNVVYSVQLLDTGAMQIRDNSANVLGSWTSTSLSVATWYRISFAYTVTNATTNEFRGWLDSVLGISLSNVTLTHTVSEQIRLSANNASADVRFSDIYVDDSNSLIDPGDIRVTAKLPFADGTAVEWTTQIGSGNSGYGSGHADEVNERALSETNGWSISTTTKKTEEYSVEGVSVGDVDLTGKIIVDYMGWVRAKNASASDTPVSNIIVGGTASAITLTTSYATYMKAKTGTTYPAGSTDIGIDGQYTTTPHLWSLAEAGLAFAYLIPNNPLPSAASLTLSTSTPVLQMQIPVTAASLTLTMSTPDVNIFGPGLGGPARPPRSREIIPRQRGGGSLRPR